MAILFLTVLGFAFPAPPANATCVDVLHSLLAEERLEVVAANTVGDALVYLLTDKSHKKTVQVGCAIQK